MFTKNRIIIFLGVGKAHTLFPDVAVREDIVFLQYYLCILYCTRIYVYVCVWCVCVVVVYFPPSSCIYVCCSLLNTKTFPHIIYPNIRKLCDFFHITIRLSINTKYLFIFLHICCYLRESITDLILTLYNSNRYQKFVLHIENQLNIRNEPKYRRIGVINRDVSLKAHLIDFPDYNNILFSHVNNCN